MTVTEKIDYWEILLKYLIYCHNLTVYKIFIGIPHEQVNETIFR